MRIAILAQSLRSRGGAERVALGWARELAARDHQVTILTYDAGPDERPPSAVGHVDVGGRNARSRWGRLPMWLRAQASGFDVVLAIGTFSNLAVLQAFPTRRRPVPVVVSERSGVRLLRTDGVAGNVKLRMAQALYRFADGAIAISHPVAADMAGTLGIASERLWVVPNPVVDGPGLADAPTPDALGRPLTLLFAGRLVRPKRPERVVATAVELRRRGYDAAVRFVGVGDLQESLAELGRRHRIECEFLPWAADWRAHADGADCLILPSDVEGFGNVLVEASTVGLPAVAPAQALGIADALVPGVTGSIALSARPAHLADAALESIAIADADGTASGWHRWFSAQNSATRLESVLRAVHDEHAASS